MILLTILGFNTTEVKDKILLLKIGIRCTSRFNAGSRIIENNLKGCFFLLLPPAGPYPIHFPNPAGQS